jgi:glycyl-tRNA synthetase
VSTPLERSTSATLEKLVALCKRRGFVYQTAEIYGGINGVYDYGHLGVILRDNLRTAWLNSLMATREDILLLDGSILGPQEMWQASGHVENFNDPMVDCLNCKHRYRTDEIDLNKPCPHCGIKKWTDVRQFNMMFKTQLGAAAEQSSSAYMRPETAQSIFVNFKNIITTNRVKIPFGVAQIGKAFRNEITPKQFLFRVREFEQMEMEWFCTADQAQEDFKLWRDARVAFYNTLGVKKDHIRVREHATDELSHYSTATVDVEYEFPFGWKELEGIAYRTDFDLKQHSKFSGKELAVFDEATKSSYIPHVVEMSVGLGRLFLTLLFNAYDEDTAEGETRIVLRLHPGIAPIKAAFLPLTKKQIEPMEKIYAAARKQGFSVQLDESGSIGKRYRRQDEIGTPFCFTYDFDSENDQSVTVRHRDSMKQERMPIAAINDFLRQHTTLSFS